MKKRTLYIFLLMFLTLTATKCKKLDKLTQFDLTYHSEITIPAGIPVATPFNIPTPPITTNTSEEFENNNTHKDLIQEIKLKSLRLEITDPANGTFSFLNKVEIYISADGLPEKKIAWKENIPDSVGGTLDLETSNDDLKDYLIQDTYELKVRTTTDEILTRDYTVNITAVFRVNAEILGI